MAAPRSVNLWPWSKSNRPKNFCTALRRLLASDRFSLTIRTLAFSAGVSRYDLRSFLEGERLPNDLELRDIAEAFVLNYFSRILEEQKQKLIAELNIVLSTDERNT